MKKEDIYHEFISKIEIKIEDTLFYIPGETIKGSILINPKYQIDIKDKLLHLSLKLIQYEFWEYSNIKIEEIKNIYKTKIQEDNIEYKLKPDDITKNQLFESFSLIEKEKKMITIPFQIKITKEKISPTFQYQSKDYFLGIRHLLLVECKEYISSNYIGLFIGKIRNQEFCSEKKIKGNFKVGLDSLELIAEFKKLSYKFDEQLNYDVKVNTNLHFQKVTKLKQEFYRKIEWIGYIKNSVLSKDILDNQKLKYNENEYGFFSRLTLPIASIVVTVINGIAEGFFGAIDGASQGYSRSTSDQYPIKKSKINNENYNKIKNNSESENNDVKSNDDVNEEQEDITDNPDVNKINDNNDNNNDIKDNSDLNKINEANNSILSDSNKDINNNIKNDSDLNKINESNNNIISNSNKVTNNKEIKKEENKINENNENKNDNNDDDNSDSKKCLKCDKIEGYIESNQIKENNNIKDNYELNKNNKPNENEKTSFFGGIIGGIFGGILGTSLGALTGFALGTAHQFRVVKDILNLNYNQNNIWNKFETKISKPEYEKIIDDSWKKFVYFKDDKVVGFIKFAYNIVPPINGYYFKCNYNIKIKLEINGIILSSKKYLKTKVDLYDSEEYVSTMKKIFKTEI